MRTLCFTRTFFFTRTFWRTFRRFALAALLPAGFLALPAGAAPFRLPAGANDIIREVGRQVGGQNSQPARQDNRGQPGRQGEYVLLDNGPMQRFPYIGMPPGYNSSNYVPQNRTLARFPFWVRTRDESRSHWLEGHVLTYVVRPDPGKSFSEYEVKQYIEGVVRRLGGTKLSEATVPNGEYYAWGREITSGFRMGAVRSRPVNVWHVPRGGGNDLWVQMVSSNSMGYMVVGEGRVMR